jgi:exopolysaccharide biosynthesis protein
MKKILIILLFLPMMVLSQKVETDTTVICIPYKAAKQMALDLNRLDSLTAVHNLTVTELSQIQNKVTFQDKIISTMEQKENNYELQIEKEKEKFVIVEGQNEDLRNQVKKLKTKNSFIEIIGGALFTTLTIFSIFK